MLNLEPYIPENFNKLSTKEKKRVIKQTANEFFKLFGVDPIAVYVQPESEDEEVRLCGKFIQYPACIYINSFFVDDDESEKLFSQLTEKDNFLPYYLLSSIAHECFHYYQYCQINKLVNDEPMTPAERETAYLYFISMYASIFHSYCVEKGLPVRDDLTDAYIYKYSPVEDTANEYARKITKQLARIDPDEKNYSYYRRLMGIANIGSYNNDFANEFDNKQTIIQYDLDVALTFLRYKNEHSGLKQPYLNINCDELERTIKEYMRKQKQSMDGTQKLLAKILKK